MDRRSTDPAAFRQPLLDTGGQPNGDGDQPSITTSTSSTADGSTLSQPPAVGATPGLSAWAVPGIRSKLKAAAERAQESLVKDRHEHNETWQCKSAQADPVAATKAEGKKNRRATMIGGGAKDDGPKMSKTTSHIDKTGHKMSETLSPIPVDKSVPAGSSPPGSPLNNSRRWNETDTHADQSSFRPRQKSRFTVVKGSRRVNVGSAVMLLRTAGQKISDAGAYMGVDWYTIQEKRHEVSFLFLVENLYYWCYAFYIIGLTVFGGFLIWILEPNSALTFAEALYSSAACVSQSGLAVVDWSKQAHTTYIVSFFLIIGGSASLLHMVPVQLRRMNFKMQANLTTIAKEKVGTDIFAVKKKFKRRNSLFDQPLMKTRAVSDPCIQPPLLVNNDPAALDEDSDESACTDAGKDSDNDDDVDTAISSTKQSTKANLSMMHSLEYIALGQTLQIMIGYWIVTHIIGIMIFYSYFYFSSGPIVDKFHADGQHNGIHAVYLTVSSFQNNGLVLTPSSVMDYSHSPILLNTIGALIICGNTGLPIMVRLIATVRHRLSHHGSQNERALAFLLEHPRRCFTHMFPATHTAWLLLVIVGLNLVMTVIQVYEDYDSKAMADLGFMDKCWNALFQSISSRTAGLNSVNLADLSQGSTFGLALMMYLATTPTVVVMRISAAKQELDITGRAEGVEAEVLTGDNSMKSQARRYLNQDLAYLATTLFFICAFEKKKFEAAARDVSPDSDGIYFDFSFFKVLFELISAYGTCGLSLGFRDQSASFSGAWTWQSQMLLIGVMMLGRLRGLPDSIDPSVRVAMEDRHEVEQEHRFIQV